MGDHAADWRVVVYGIFWINRGPVLSRQLIIGDIHGCYFTLKALLKQMRFDASKDHLLILGDLVGKGPHTASVLDYLMDLPQCQMVYGNHDLYLIQAYSSGLGRDQHYKDIVSISKHPKMNRWYEWMSGQHFSIVGDFGCAVHASVAPEWTVDDLSTLSRQYEEELRLDPVTFFQDMRPPELNRWSEGLLEEEKRWLGIQIMTRARYYTPKGLIDLNITGSPEEHPDLIPWYEKKRRINLPIWFGHWAALKGRSIDSDVINLDGGAVYGGRLLGGDTASKHMWSQAQEGRDVS